MVSAPIDVECPARQLLAGVPLALTKVQKATLAVFMTQFMHQFGGKTALGGAKCICVPFWCVAVTDGDKSGLATHREAYVAVNKLFVDRMPECHDLGPLVFGVGFGDTGRLINAGHCHVVRKFHLAFVRAALNRCCTGRVRCARHRNVAFTRQQSRGGIQPDPAGSGQIHLAPGVKVSEVNFGATWAVQGLDVRLQLNQVTRHKSRRQPAVTQQIDHQPSRITARA